MNLEENNDELFADLFAYRFALLDIYEHNEREIIIKLKIKLFELGYNRNNINNLIYSFYNYYHIPIEEIDINNANVMIYMYNNSNRDYQRRISLYSAVLNVLNRLDNIIDENEEENIETLTEEEFNELEVIKIDKNYLTNDMECSICIDKFELNQNVIKLQCNHLYHKECIKSHLLNYNNKCPLCRGNAK